MPAVVADEADAYLFLEQLRWNGTPDVCPQCGVQERCYYLTPADGRTRATRSGARSQRRIWKCGACRKQFSVLTGTILQGTKVSVLTWLAMIADVTRDGVPVAADRYGVSSETARHMVGRFRAAMTSETVRSALARIEASQTR